MELTGSGTGGTWAQTRDRRRALSFGEDPKRYDEARPDYPAALIDKLVAGSPRTALDVGCGTGIAACLLRERDCEVLGVEPDRRMATVARTHGLQVEVARFEDWDPAGRHFDLLTCGQAWHWIDSVSGIQKVAAVLRPGGMAAFFWNEVNHEPETERALRALYRRMAPELERGSVVLGNGIVVDRIEATSAAVTASGAFEAPEIGSFPWERTYSSSEWIDLLQTHSDHRMMAPLQREALLAAVGDAIDAFGGIITVYYHCRLVAAKRDQRSAQGG